MRIERRASTRVFALLRVIGVIAMLVSWTAMTPSVDAASGTSSASTPLRAQDGSDGNGTPGGDEAEDGNATDNPNGNGETDPGDGGIIIGDEVTGGDTTGGDTSGGDSTGGDATGGDAGDGGVATGGNGSGGSGTGNTTGASTDGGTSVGSN